MKVVIMFTHPFRNPDGPQVYGNKVHDFNSALDDVGAVSALIASEVGFTPGKNSRVSDGRAVVFPDRYHTGFYSGWLAPMPEGGAA